jgi:hypothetical protein
VKKAIVNSGRAYNKWVQSIKGLLRDSCARP